MIFLVNYWKKKVLLFSDYDDFLSNTCLFLELKWSNFQPRVSFPYAIQVFIAFNSLVAPYYI